MSAMSMWRTTGIGMLVALALVVVFGFATGVFS
jgi:hypothetical protein